MQIDIVVVIFAEKGSLQNQHQEAGDHVFYNLLKINHLWVAKFVWFLEVFTIIFFSTKKKRES